MAFNLLTEIKSKYIICPKCHEIYDDGSVYCVDCGTRLVKEKVKDAQGNPIERFSRSALELITTFFFSLQPAKAKTAEAAKTANKTFFIKSPP